MDNQHKQITGYRDLSQAEIDLMNEIKAQGTQLYMLVQKLAGTPGIDMRWVEIGRNQLQQGVMALVRAVAKPATF